MDLSGVLTVVHVASLATDEGFIRFDRAGHLVDAPGTLCVANPVKHEPCRLLSYLKHSRDLVGRHAVLAIGQHPHRGKPLAQTDGRILENRAHFYAELLAAREAGPHQPCLEKRELLTLTARTLWAFRPLHL